MSNGPTMLDAWLAGHAHREAFEDLTPQQINDMEMETYARLTGRSLKFTAEPVAEPPAALPDTAFTQQATDRGQTLEELALTDDDAWLQWRQERMRNSGSGEGIGVFSGTGSQSAEYRRAARAQAGRTGWANGNVTEPPRIEGRYLRHDDNLDHRSAVERLSNAATLWQGR